MTASLSNLNQSPGWCLSQNQVKQECPTHLLFQKQVSRGTWLCQVKQIPLNIFYFLKIIFFFLKMYFQASFLMGKPATWAAFFLCLIRGPSDSAANKSPFDDLYIWKKNIGSRKIASDHIEGWRFSLMLTIPFFSGYDYQNSNLTVHFL